MRLWRSIADDFDLDVHEQLLLLEACRCADRLDRLDVEARANDVTVINMKGDPVAHPAMVESRQQAIVLSRLLASLRMPSGESEDRPQRRGASRAPYTGRAHCLRCVMTAGVVPVSDLQSLEPLDTSARELAVTAYLSQARDQLAHAV